ncbi:hypothetical protein GCM10011394_24410 [Luteimonas terricola]|uniref:Lipid A biosynthesis N-terminal domain-containing protein n=1 Tax=Luteimonas terricola TaxID=645597 RepID=A0ABQ2EKA8_9GAMM|nr:hypothetical protein GCM10011394_24410 [Luteimonas terricola]
MNETIAALAWTGVAVTPWKLIGLFGAMLFGARWLVQFGASRRAGRAVVPRSFWIISLCGSGLTLSYFIFSEKQDAVGVLQNLLPALTAAYSLWLELRPARPGVPQQESNSGAWSGESSGSRKPASPTPASR